MKIFNFVFGILFLVCALLQYNDPDPYVWVTIYVAGAWLCYHSCKKNPAQTHYHVIIIALSAYAMYILFAGNGVRTWLFDRNDSLISEMQAGSPWIEESREFFGLVILISVQLINLGWQRSLARPGGTEVAEKATV